MFTVLAVPRSAPRTVALLAIIGELAVSVIWDRFRERLKKPEASWGDHAASSLSLRLGHVLSPPQRRVLLRWPRSLDVFAIVAGLTDENRSERIEQVVAGLEFELGPPSEANRALAAELVTEVFVYLAELVDPAVVIALTEIPQVSSSEEVR